MLPNKIPTNNVRKNVMKFGTLSRSQSINSVSAQEFQSIINIISTYIRILLNNPNYVIVIMYNEEILPPTSNTMSGGSKITDFIRNLFKVFIVNKVNRVAPDPNVTPAVEIEFTPVTEFIPDEQNEIKRLFTNLNSFPDNVLMEILKQLAHKIYEENSHMILNSTQYINKRIKQPVFEVHKPTDIESIKGVMIDPILININNRLINTMTRAIQNSIKHDYKFVFDQMIYNDQILKYVLKEIPFIETETSLLTTAKNNSYTLSIFLENFKPLLENLYKRFNSVIDTRETQYNSLYRPVMTIRFTDENSNYIVINLNPKSKDFSYNEFNSHTSRIFTTFENSEELLRYVDIEGIDIYFKLETSSFVYMPLSFGKSQLNEELNILNKIGGKKKTRYEQYTKKELLEKAKQRHIKSVKPSMKKCDIIVCLRQKNGTQS